MKKFSFAHLIGAGTSVAAKKADGDTDTDDRKQRDGESDDDYADRLKKMDDDGSDDKDGKKSKKAVKAESDDDEDKEDKEDEKDDAKKAARLRERARCAAIFAHPAAAKNPALAATLAFSTDLPKAQAIEALEVGGSSAATPTPVPAAAEPKTSTLDQRMRASEAAAAASKVGPGGDAEKPDMNTAKGRAAAILASGNGANTVKSKA